jgi:hypothetical protein
VGPVNSKEGLLRQNIAPAPVVESSGAGAESAGPGPVDPSEPDEEGIVVAPVSEAPVAASHDAGESGGATQAAGGDMASAVAP